MPKSSERMTKAQVLATIRELRDMIRHYTSMTRLELEEALKVAFPHAADKAEDQTTENIIRTLLIAHTHYMTNILNLE